MPNTRTETMGESFYIALVGLCGIIMVPIINGLFGAFKRTREAELIAKHKEKIACLQATIKKSYADMSLDELMKGYEQAMGRIDAIAEDPSNSITRILMFKAVNGQYNPEFTTCWHEKRTGSQRHYPYIDYPITPSYVKKLRETYDVPSLNMIVAELEPDVQPRSIYSMEGVSQTVWVHFVTKLKPSNKAEIFYASFSCMADDVITQSNITEIEIACSQLRNFMARL